MPGTTKLLLIECIGLVLVAVGVVIAFVAVLRDGGAVGVAAGLAAVRLGIGLLRRPGGDDFEVPPDP
jgi:hypothetical protein